MRGQELSFFLKRSGLNYEEYAKSIGRSRSTVQRWITDGSHIKELHVLALEKILTKPVFEIIQADWIRYKRDNYLS